MKEQPPIMTVDETLGMAQTLTQMTECLQSPYLTYEEERTLRPLTDALTAELIFFGNDEAFKDTSNSPI